MSAFFRQLIWFGFLTMTPVQAYDSSPYYSEEYLPVFPRIQEDYIDRPLTLGVFYQGTTPRLEHSDQLFSLASVKKIITAATALRVLGNEFKFVNEFTGEFNQERQALTHPRFSVSGDPTWGHPSYGESLTTRVFKVAQELKRWGVLRVEGPIQIELLSPVVGAFARPKDWKPSWLLACYASLPTPVSLNGNCAQLVISREKSFWMTGGVSTEIENKLIASSVDSVQVTPILNELGRVKKYVLSGGISRPTSIYLPVHDNEGWLKNLFLDQLKKTGIEYSEQSEASFEEAGSPIYVDLSSKKLKEMLPPFLQESINLVGERLHLEAEDDLATFASMISNPDVYQTATLVDGSGLMAANRVTPKAMYGFLMGLQNQSYFHDLYRSLPISGVSGTLKSRMTSPLLKGRVHAKTGTIDHVVNLAGYWVKQNDSLEPFVIFTDSSLIPQSARKIVDDIVDDFARKN